LSGAACNDADTVSSRINVAFVLRSMSLQNGVNDMRRPSFLSKVSSAHASASHCGARCSQTMRPGTPVGRDFANLARRKRSHPARFGVFTDYQAGKYHVFIRF
jgi:hypothetical protein